MCISVDFVFDSCDVRMWVSVCVSVWASCCIMCVCKNVWYSHIWCREYFRVHIENRVFLFIRWERETMWHAGCRLFNNCYKFISWPQKGQGIFDHSIFFHCQLNSIELSWFEYLRKILNSFGLRDLRFKFPIFTHKECIQAIRESNLTPFSSNPIQSTPNEVNAWNERENRVLWKYQVNYDAFHSILLQVSNKNMISPRMACHHIYMLCLNSISFNNFPADDYDIIIISYCISHSWDIFFVIPRTIVRLRLKQTLNAIVSLLHFVHHTVISWLKLDLSNFYLHRSYEWNEMVCQTLNRKKCIIIVCHLDMCVCTVFLCVCAWFLIWHNSISDMANK